MKKHPLKTVLTGLGWGCLSFWWLFLALLLLLPDSSPGSLDWEHDVFLIPLGLALVTVYLAAAVLLIVKECKEKRSLLLFVLAALTSFSGMVLFRLL